MGTLKKTARAEDWDTIDAQLPGVSNFANIIGWAKGKGMLDPNPHLRDLAMSILEQSDWRLSPKKLAKVGVLMETDKSPYVRARAAFALFKRGIRTEVVLKTLHEALADDDLREVAQGYLTSLHESEHETKDGEQD